MTDSKPNAEPTHTAIDAVRRAFDEIALPILDARAIRALALMPETEMLHLVAQFDEVSALRTQDMAERLERAKKDAEEAGEEKTAADDALAELKQQTEETFSDARCPFCGAPLKITREGAQQAPQDCASCQEADAEREEFYRRNPTLKGRGMSGPVAVGARRGK